MAAGSTDANGVYHIGESDNPDGTFSGLMGLITLPISNLIGALQKKAPYSWANATARNAQTGMVLGEKGLQRDTGTTYRYDGTAWKAWDSGWLTYTPTIANFTPGTGSTIAGRYRYEGGDVVGEIDGSMGTGSSMGSSPTFTTPVNMASDYLSDAPLGDGMVLVAGTNYQVTVLRNATDAGKLAAYVRNVAGTYETVTGLSATIPGTWGTTGKFQLRFRFRAG